MEVEVKVVTIISNEYDENWSNFYKHSLKNKIVKKDVFEYLCYLVYKALSRFVESNYTDIMN